MEREITGGNGKWWVNRARAGKAVLGRRMRWTSFSEAGGRVTTHAWARGLEQGDGYPA